MRKAVTSPTDVRDFLDQALYISAAIAGAAMTGFMVDAKLRLLEKCQYRGSRVELRQSGSRGSLTRLGNGFQGIPNSYNSSTHNCTDCTVFSS